MEAMNDQQRTADTDHLDAVMSSRGFKVLPAIDGTYPGDEVRVYESSAASGPHMWLRVRNDGSEAAAHLTVEAAVRVAEQLLWLVANHYQGDEG